MKLAPCPACHRHVDTSAEACPFCSAALISPAARPPLQRIVTRETVAVAVGIGLALTACACYGPPPRAHYSPPPDPTEQPPGESDEQKAPASPEYAQPPPGERAD